MRTQSTIFRDEFIRNLPYSVRNLIQLIGYEKTRTLLIAFGGTRKYIPKKSTQDHPIQKKIGDESFRYICMKYSGETLEFPKPDSLLRAERNGEILDETIRGASRNTLGKKFKLSRRQIGNIRKLADQNYP